MTPPIKLLDKKLSEALNEPWGTRGLIRYEISGINKNSTKKSASGNLQFFICTRQNEEKMIFEQQFIELDSTDSVDSFLADALSRLLESHSSWPR